MAVVPFSDDAPLLSVCIITYNHEPFVSEAIASALAQRTSFPIEIVIGEDGSKDRTASIVRELSEEHPKLIRARFNSPNMGMMPNLIKTLSECRGRYIALLEGDDYWTDPLKLQRQVDFLEAHSEYAICFHPVLVREGDTVSADTRTRNVSDDTDIYDLALGNFIHTCSAVYRAGLVSEFPEEFSRSPVGDYFLHMLNARHGRIHRLPQTMGVYRVHPGGAWSTIADMDLKILNYLELMVGNFDDKVNSLLARRHGEVAFRAFLARLGTPGSSERLNRCFRFGTSVFSEQALPWIEAAAKLQRHLAGRIVRRLFRSQLR